MITTRTCPNLDEELASLLNDGYRLDMIMPADDPREAIVSRNGESLRLISAGGLAGGENVPNATAGDTGWVKGRAGMEYRDLIPDRLGGRVVASHIRIRKGGEVPDYVHYHKIGFQMIYCTAGWIRVMYEEQGPPFVLNAGDCVLQPPEMRHRVLESSAGAEVIEVSCPAVHETWVDHDLQIPKAGENPGRMFQGQRFVRFVRKDAIWQEGADGYSYSDTGIGDATGGSASVRVIRMNAHTKREVESDDERKQFIFVISGRINIRSAEGSPIDLEGNDCCVLSEGINYETLSAIDSEILQVSLPPH